MSNNQDAIYTERMSSKFAKEKCEDLLMYLNHRSIVDSQKRKMRNIFKILYIDAALASINTPSTDWKCAISRLEHMWDNIEIHSKLIEDFTHCCNTRGLPHSCFSFNDAFCKVASKWRGEMMVEAAERIILRYMPTTSPVVGWNFSKQSLVIDHDLVGDFRVWRRTVPEFDSK